MKKLKVASFITLLLPFVVIGVCYLTANRFVTNWALLIIELVALIFAFALFGFISLVMNGIVIKKDGLGFVSFILLLLSLAEFGFGAYCLLEVFLLN